MGKFYITKQLFLGGSPPAKVAEGLTEQEADKFLDHLERHYQDGYVIYEKHEEKEKEDDEK